MNQSRTLIFLHIPKNAGTSLRKIVERFYDKKDIYYVYASGDGFNDLNDFLELSGDVKREIKVLMGHIGYGIHRDFVQPCTYVTLLRNPVERILSLYSHISQAPRHPYYHRIKSENMDLSIFLGSGITPATDNHQTRILSGIHPEYGKCTREMLDQAKENLKNHFSVVGITEYFVESIFLMKRILGWKAPFHRRLLGKILGWKTPYYDKFNVSINRSRKEDLPEATLSLIYSLNELDMELYSYAKELFRHQIDQQGRQFEKKLEKFRREILS